MSLDSPPIRRLSNASSAASRQEGLINAYEAEEERITNILYRKLEQLREEKINIENAHEAESESHVNRMAREFAQRLQEISSNSVSTSPDAGGIYLRPSDPTAETMLEAMRRENEQLRSRLVDAERGFIRISRLNEVYREELIRLRRRLGMAVDDLIGLSSVDPLSQPTHRRSSTSSNASSPSTSVMHLSTHTARLTHGVPIPRPPSQIHRPGNLDSEGNTPLSHSPSSSESPFPFSPMTNPGSLVSPNTNITSPPSSLSFNANAPIPFGTPMQGLTYPSVPPPSLSSSFGSPMVSHHVSHRDASLSPVEPLSRRSSNARRGSEWRVGESGAARGVGRSGEHSHRGSLERRARVAETGTLIPRSRADSQSLNVSVEAGNGADISVATVAIKPDGGDSKTVVAEST